MKNENTLRVLKTLTIVGFAVGTTAFGVDEWKTETQLGETVSYAIDKLWSGAGITVAGGLLIASGAWEAYRTDSPKKVGYAIAATALLAGAFTMGPSILAAMP